MFWALVFIIVIAMIGLSCINNQRIRFVVGVVLFIGWIVALVQGALWLASADQPSDDAVAPVAAAEQR